MSISTDLARLNQAKIDIAAAIEEKGVDVPEGTKIDGFPPLILEIQGGGGGYPYNVSDFAYTNADDSITLTWQDTDDPAWAGTVIVAKRGSYPTDADDGIVIVDSKVRDQYAETGYTKGDLEAGEWFLQAFPYNLDGEYSDNVVNRLQVTVTYIYPSALTSFAARAGNTTVTLSYELPEDATGLTVVYKAGSAPTSLEDGTVLDNPATGYIVTGLTNEMTYYFRAEPYNQYGRYGTASTSEATPMPYVRFGYRHYTDNGSPALVRLGDAVGLSAVAGIGSDAGHSDFDNKAIYSGVRVCNLSADGTVNAYEGDEGFTRDGTNGDVMVEIPRFYYKRFQGTDDTGAYTETWISDGIPDADYAIHPAFTPYGSQAPLEHIYVSAYETSSGYASKTGQSPLVSITRAAARTGAANKGLGWSQLDIAAASAVNMLIFTEFANLNGQAVIGSGNSNTSAAIKTGTTDSMAGHTGRAAGTDTAVGMKWRGIENWWGNVWKWVDGINVNALAYYISLNHHNYADDTATNYTPTGLTAPSGASQSYIKAMSYSEDMPWLMVPTAVGGSATTYFCDGLWTSAGWRLANLGGNWSHGAQVGPSAWAFDDASSGARPGVGCRLLYRPQSEPSTSYNIYGISRNITASSPEWRRTDDADGFTATASVGTVAGSSSFDNCMPWSGIRRCNLAADGTVKAYMGEDGYAVDGSNGDVMVEIPKFWYRRFRYGDIEYIQIADGAADGFALHPAFNHAGIEADYAYVGAYKTSSNNKSVTGASPTDSATRASFRTNAKNKGAGWSIIDIAAISAIQMLALVEFATNNAQAVIGRGYCDGNSASLKSGSCDSVPNLTGRPSGTDGKTGVVYRGIEDFWGNIWERVDGVNFNGGKYYVCNDISKYADDTATNYEELSFTGATNWSQSYITQEGLDDGDNAHVMLPSAAGSGSETTYQCDACWSSTGWRVFIHGGNWINGSNCGLFTAYLSGDSSNTSTHIGSRLLYVPQSAQEVSA